MKRLSTDELRQTFLDFFAKNGHSVIPGASLIPENDPTVLFTTAGMHPLVPYLMGEKHPAGTRLVDVQRCVRTGDIDEVGDSTHLTCFEMLGNWSLGDYFKEESITLSFRFLTEELEIPLGKLAVTCFEGDSDAPKDEESAGIWMNLGVSAERIGFLPKKDNWWGPAGQTGPCGPDTEIFYWVGKSDLPPSGSNPATDDENWMEIWNNVFMQYNKQEDPSSGSGQAHFVPLSQKNVDTGMGLERTAAVLQGVSNVYETDRLGAIMQSVATLTNGDGPLKHQRIVTDHLKASVFMIADGVQPSNVDQGYVLRRLIRRAIRSARQLGIEGKICEHIASVVIDQYGHVYPHVERQRTMIVDTLMREEEQFAKTLSEGLKQFSKLREGMSGTMIDGPSAFRLYDTYGFPLELTQELATEQGLTVDEAGFHKAFEEHQAKSRAGAAQKFSGGLADHSAETTKLHTATHLLNAALRQVLGDHVQQKGSNITADRLRFDFNHEDKLTPEQIAEVERLVNQAIEANLPVSYHTTTVDGAKEEGAIGVFDERYDAEVKVYQMGPSTSSGRGEWSERPFSLEICGGPHVANSGMLGSFRIKKEESSSKGVRRIKAVVNGGPEEIDVAKEITMDN